MASRLESLSDCDCDAVLELSNESQSAVDVLVVVELAVGVEKQQIEDKKVPLTVTAKGETPRDVHHIS